MMFTRRVAAGTTPLALGAIAVLGACATTAEPRPAADPGDVATTAEPQTGDLADRLPVFAESRLKYDDAIGFEEYYVVVGDHEVQTVDGVIRRLFFQPEEGHSPLEVMRFYEGVIADQGGTILFQTRDARDIEIDGESLVTYFNKERLDRGLSTYVWDFTHFPGAASEYLAAVVPFDGKDAFVVVAAGRPDREVPEFSGVRFELVTVVP